MALSFDIWDIFEDFTETATINGQASVKVIALEFTDNPNFADDGYNQNVAGDIRCKVADLTGGVPKNGKKVTFRTKTYRIMAATIDSKNVTVILTLGEEFKK